MIRSAVRVVAAVASLALAACSSGGALDTGGGGAIEEAVIRPGVSAIQAAEPLACETDAKSLNVAIEAFTALTGAPPNSEAALVSEGMLRDESKLWDVVGGQLVAVDPGCGAITGPNTQITAPATTLGEIVTSVEAPKVDDVLAGLSEDDIAEVGGIECATEIAHIFAASEQFIAEQGVEPKDIDDLIAAGYLEVPITMWHVVDDELVPAEGSPCTDPNAVDQAEACVIAARTLEVAREAYFAMNPNAAEPTEADLLTAQLIREEFVEVDLVDGVPVAAPDGPCVGVDLQL